MYEELTNLAVASSDRFWLIIKSYSARTLFLLRTARLSVASMSSIMGFSFPGFLISALRFGDEDRLAHRRTSRARREESLPHPGQPLQSAVQDSARRFRSRAWRHRPRQARCLAYC